MFGGIVETIGTVKKHLPDTGGLALTIVPHIPFNDLNIGDSVAINGTCLTVTKFDNDTFDVYVVPETLRLTNLDFLYEKAQVNLERSLKLGSRLGGHFVQGHVDGIGEIVNLEQDGDKALLATIKCDASLMKFIVKKGFITLDGMSITLVDVKEQEFTVTFIPHTQDVTLVKQYKIGSKINIEVDMLGKYIANIVQPII